MNEDLFWRRAVVFGSALVYWAGVLIQARRVRRQIGKSPNLRPRGARERLLWAGWLVVIAIWLMQPLLLGVGGVPSWLQPPRALLQAAGLILGVILIGAGYVGTLWCYAAMGNAWRIGINRREKNALITHGPYRFVRHPIYLFQVVMLAGAMLLLPALLSAAALALHLFCVYAKASDEESYLRTVHGQEYQDYLARSGRLLPKWRTRRCPPRDSLA